MPTKIERTPEMCADIRRVYENWERGGRQRIMKKYRISASLVSKIAIEMNLQLKKSFNSYTENEDRIIIQYADHTPAEIQNIFRSLNMRVRTVLSISDRRAILRKRDDIPPHGCTRDSYTAEMLAESMGVPSSRVISWIKQKNLKADIVSVDSTTGKAKQYRITNKAIYDFLITCTNRYKINPNNQYWFIKALTFNHNQSALHKKSCGVVSELSDGHEEHAVLL